MWEQKRKPTDGRRPRRCKTRYLWWPYAKNCIRVYPDRVKQLEAADGDTAELVSDIDWGPPRPTERLAVLHLRDLSRSEQWKREYDGVRMAVEETENLPDGRERLSLIDKVFWKRTHTIQGAAMECHVSERTAVQWHGDFIRLVAVHMGLLGRDEQASF